MCLKLSALEGLCLTVQPRKQGESLCEDCNRCRTVNNYRSGQKAGRHCRAAGRPDLWQIWPEWRSLNSWQAQICFIVCSSSSAAGKRQLNSGEPWLLGKRLAHCATSGMAAGPAGTRRVCFNPDLHFGWSKPLNSECIQLSPRWLGLFIFIFLKLLILISSKMSSLELRDTCDCWEQRAAVIMQFLGKA